jgi:glycosyltransferase involved in cell wall biosynthesis
MIFGIMDFRQKLRVAQIAMDPFADPISGAELRNHALCHALRRFASVETIAIHPLCSNPNDVSVTRQHRTVKQFSEPLAARVLKAIRAAEPEVVLLEGVELLALAEMLRRAWRSLPPRLVIDFHNVESCLLAEIDAARLPNYLQPLASTLYRRRWHHARQADARAAELAEQVWVCSAADATRVTALQPTGSLGARVHVVRNVVPPWCQDALEQEVAMIPAQGDAWRAVFVGHLRYPPNRRAVHRLLGAIWPALRARYPRMRLTLAGRRPSRSLRRRASRTLGVDLAADPEDLHAFYRDADVAIIPLEQGGGSRLKVLEAFALGVPVVATDKAVEGLDLVAGTHWLRANSVQEYVAQLGRLMESPSLREELTSAGRELVRSQHSFDALERTLQKVLQSPSPS